MISCYRIVNEKTREVSFMPRNDAPEIRAANGINDPLLVRVSAFLFTLIAFMVISSLKILFNKT